MKPTTSTQTASSETALAVRNPEQGKVGWALAWLIGIPLPLLLVVYLFTRAC